MAVANAPDNSIAQPRDPGGLDYAHQHAMADLTAPVVRGNENHCWTSVVVVR